MLSVPRTADEGLPSGHFLLTAVRAYPGRAPRKAAVGQRTIRADERSVAVTPSPMLEAQSGAPGGPLSG